MKIYTRRGDKGKTSLLGGIRVSKDHPRVAAYGTIDELNSYLGFVTTLLSSKQKKFLRLIFDVQSDLWEIESELATAPGKTPPFILSEAKVKKLEKIIDNLEAKLPPLQHFVFPGGSKAAAALHVARCVARRAEREVVKLCKKRVLSADQQQKVNPNILAYLNRLSDFLFVLARTVNKVSSKKEVVWRGKS
jgi:cob(I)alamin adenosyltransferase